MPRETYLQAINRAGQSYYWFHVVGSLADVWYPYMLIYLVTNASAVKSASSVPLQEWPQYITLFLVEQEQLSDGTVRLLKWKQY